MPVGLAAQDVIIVPWLLREFAVYPGAQVVHVLAETHKMQFVIQLTHLPVESRNCPIEQSGRHFPLLRVPLAQLVH